MKRGLDEIANIALIEVIYSPRRRAAAGWPARRPAMVSWDLTHVKTDSKKR